MSSNPRDHQRQQGHYHSDRHRQQQRPSRWNNNTNNNNRELTTTKEVTDDEAMRALLSSAEARERERNQDINNNNNKKRSFNANNDSNERGYHRGSGDDRSGNGNYNKNKRPRWGGGSNNNNNSAATNNKSDSRSGQRLQENDSYYGPSSSRQQQGGDKNEVGENDKNNIDSKQKYGMKTTGDDGKDVDDDNDDEGEKSKIPEQKPNFGLSGALSKDSNHATTVYKGIKLKFQEPPEARSPNTQWRFYVFKDKDLLETLHISKQSAYLMGRNQDICDIHMLHPSMSSQHAVLQYRALPDSNNNGRLQCRPYIMDLESSNGTKLNGIPIDPARYYQLRKGDVLTFGASTREYVLMTENTTSI